MTPLNKNISSREDIASKLLDEVKEKGPSRLADSIEGVESLSPDEEAGLERGGNYALRAVKRKFVRDLWGFLIVPVRIILLALSAGLVYILYRYFNGLEEYHSIQDIVQSILAYFFGIVSTIAVEILWNKKNSSNN